MTEKVEKYKQKDSVIALGKRIKQVGKVRKALTMRLMKIDKEKSRLEQILEGIDGGMEQLRSMVPQKPTKELDGQEEV